MDAILSGEATIDNAKKLKAQICELFLRADFELHKWVSNSPDLQQDLSTSSYCFDKGQDAGSVKTLGLWKIKLDWSEQLPPVAMKGRKKFYLKLSKVNNFKIQRYILLPGTVRVEIHGFSDASGRTYAAVLYLKCFDESGQFKTSLLCSKSRVAPLKTLTISSFSGESREGYGAAAPPRAKPEYSILFKITTTACS
ncbi:hypothetical protein AVEN_168586-1 [Araneus ventricosus]|uniref:Uncharacterized protein n=1 Tax=Araneus ventricosus TaxID=182803 RepID=A0A4Y2KHZ0_ARAVE|nr:hypothetical protein AVEN_168586-1 [Araneus ventricosus]